MIGSECSNMAGVSRNYLSKANKDWIRRKVQMEQDNVGIDQRERETERSNGGW